MTDLKRYWKRVMEFPAIVERPEAAKLEALASGGARVLAERDSAYQRILLLETPKGYPLLLLDGEIQFYGGDEHRYHECLALVPMMYAREPVRRVGIMGGGDGLIARELLAHHGEEIERIRVIDIDPAVTELARSQPELVRLNGGSLLDERVEVINADALTYQAQEPFDLIICDLPDPINPALARLYNREYYEGLRGQLNGERALLATQIMYFPPLFDGMLTTLRSVFRHVTPYAVSMYSFVRCGFALAADRGFERERGIPAGTRYLTPQVLDWLFYFPPDEPRVEISEPSTEANGKVMDWYESYLRENLEERILFY